MEVVYTAHLLFRLKTRKIPHNLPEKIVKQADRFYIDNQTNLSIAVKNLSRQKTYMVAFITEGDTIRVITIHPLKRYQELNRVKSNRWQRINRTI
jgi:hypothetical protein